MRPQIFTFLALAMAVLKAGSIEIYSVALTTRPEAQSYHTYPANPANRYGQVSLYRQIELDWPLWSGPLQSMSWDWVNCFCVGFQRAQSFFYGIIFDENRFFSPYSCIYILWYSPFSKTVSCSSIGPDFSKKESYWIKQKTKVVSIIGWVNLGAHGLIFLGSTHSTLCSVSMVSDVK